MSRDVSVLVVGYRRMDLLARCLAAVETHLPGLRVLVWDNSGPSAPGRDELMAAYPRVSWRLSEANVGFAAAVNALAELAGDDDLLLLNPDAELLGPLTATRAALTDDVAAAAPRLADARPDTDPTSPDCDPTRPDTDPTHRDWDVAHRDWDVAHRRLGLTRALVAHSGYAGRLRGTPLSDLYARPPEDVAGYLTGACLLISRAAWRAVGAFDEEFFLYGEEADWQQRARRAGWRLRLVDEVGVRHTGHGTVEGDADASRRSTDLLRANVALNLERDRGVHRADAFLAGMGVLDRVQRSSRRARSTRLAASRRSLPPVVLTINRLDYGGAERHHAILAGELSRRGHDVIIACMQRLGPLIREIDPSVRVVRQPWWAPALDVRRGPAVVISGDTNTETGFAALWRRCGRGRRWLVAPHIPPAPNGPTYGRALARAMSAADGFVALSGRHRDEITAHHDLGPRWHLAPNAVARAGTTVAATPDENRPRNPDRPLQLVMLSRIVEHKNPHLLVEALAGLTDLDWELRIFGDGPDRARLEARTPAALRGRVHWQGWSPGPDHAFADCDLACVPSGSEAFPLVVLEAMARAIPVIASGVCSVPEMLDAGRAGLVVEPVDVPSWRARLRDALQEPDRLPDLGRAGLARMRAEYTIEAMADAYEAAIDDVLTGSSPKR